MAGVTATVRSHVQNLLGKLGVHSMLEAAAFAFEHGMVTVNGGATWDRHSAQRSQRSKDAP